MPPGATANADHLGPEDSQHIDIVNVQEGILEEEIDEEIEDEIQPLSTDDCRFFFSLKIWLILSYICIAFPPRQGSEENLPTIPDPWEGPEVYAEDFYSGGDVRTLPGEPIDPSLLTGTGDLDDGIDAFLTPGALSASQSEHISIVVNEEDVDEDARAPGQHHVTASRRDQPIPADAEFISIDDSDDEQEKEQEAKLQDIQPVSKEADYGGICDFEAAWQEMEENVDEDQHIVVSPFGTANQGHTITVEHDDHFEQVSHVEQQIFYGEENEDNLDILTSAEARNGLSYFISYFLKLTSAALGVISDFGDVSSSTFLSEISPSNFAIPSSARELSAVASKQEADVVSDEVKIDNAESSQENIHPAEVIELDVVQEEIMVDVVKATSEHVIDLDAQFEGATISEINAPIGIISSEGAENAFIRDQVIVDKVQDISVSAEESAGSVEETTNIDEEVAENIPTDVEAQNVNPKRKEILVDGMYASTFIRRAPLTYYLPQKLSLKSRSHLPVSIIERTRKNLPQISKIQRECKKFQSTFSHPALVSSFKRSLLSRRFRKRSSTTLPLLFQLFSHPRKLVLTRECKKSRLILSLLPLPPQTHLPTERSKSRKCWTKMLLPKSGRN